MEIQLLPPSGLRNWRIECRSEDTQLVKRFRLAARRVLCSNHLDDPYHRKYRPLHAFHQGDGDTWQQFEFWSHGGKDLMEEALAEVQMVMKNITVDELIFLS